MTQDCREIRLANALMRINAGDYSSAAADATMLAGEIWRRDNGYAPFVLKSEIVLFGPGVRVPGEVQ